MAYGRRALSMTSSDSKRQVLMDLMVAPRNEEKLESLRLWVRLVD
jgi:hypothetical protein